MFALLFRFNNKNEICVNSFALSCLIASMLLIISKLDFFLQKSLAPPSWTNISCQLYFLLPSLIIALSCHSRTFLGFLCLLLCFLFACCLSTPDGFTSKSSAPLSAPRLFRVIPCLARHPWHRRHGVYRRHSCRKLRWQCCGHERVYSCVVICVQRHKHHRFYERHQPPVWWFVFRPSAVYGSHPHVFILWLHRHRWYGC